MKKLAPLLFLLILMACEEASPVKTAEQGKPIPNFRIQKDSIWGYYTDSITAGTPSVFIYFATYCPYSRAEIEDILDNINNMKYVRFYLVSAEPLPSIKKFIAAYNLNGYHNISTGQDYNVFFSKHFKVPGVPYTVIYNKDRILEAAFYGRIGSKDIMKYIKG